MIPAQAEPSLEDVLESFAIDSAQDPGSLARYLGDYPQFSVALIDLAHDLLREPFDEADVELDSEAKALIEAGWTQLQRDQAPVATQSLFAAKTPQQMGEVATQLSVPRQVILAIRDGFVIIESIPRRFLRRLADALAGTVDQLRSGIGGQHLARASYKADGRIESGEPVSFEQILIEAGVPEDLRAELLADDG
jgi:hypothetical protein